MSIFESSLAVRQSFPEGILTFSSKETVHAFDEDALILWRLLGYRLVLLGRDEPYLKTSFPASSLRKAASRIREVLKLPLRTLAVTEDGVAPEPVFETRFPTKLRKADYVRRSDVASRIEEIREFTESEAASALQAFSNRSDERFELHEKAKDAFAHVASAILRYMPKAVRPSVGHRYLSEWADLIAEINRLRSVPEYLRDDRGEFVKFKIRILVAIATRVDTLRDLTDAAYSLKGFKNRAQYAFVSTKVAEIGKINRGILAKNERLLANVVSEA